MEKKDNAFIELERSRPMPILISFRSAFSYTLSSIFYFLVSPQVRSAQSETICIIITGLGGMPEYEENFLSWGLATEAHFQDELESVVYRLDGRDKKKSDILQLFEQISSSPHPKGPVAFLDRTCQPRSSKLQVQYLRPRLDG